MDGLQRIYANLDPDFWWWMLGMSAMLVAIPILERVVYAYRQHRHRVDERTRHELLPEERYAAKVTVGDPPKDIQVISGILGLLGVALFLALPAIIEVYGLPAWLEWAILLALLIATPLLGLWRRINNPPEPEDDNWSGPSDLPREAIFGFLAAVAVIAILLFVDRLA